MVFTFSFLFSLKQGPHTKMVPDDANEVMRKKRKRSEGDDLEQNVTEDFSFFGWKSRAVIFLHSVD